VRSNYFFQFIYICNLNFEKVGTDKSTRNIVLHSLLHSILHTYIYVIYIFVLNIFQKNCKVDQYLLFILSRKSNFLMFFFVLLLKL